MKLSRILEVLVILALLLAYGALARAWDRPTRAAAITVTTGHYQLDTGDTVTWWLDEPRALLCTMIPDTGLSCLPLNATPYAWPALPEDK